MAFIRFYRNQPATALIGVATFVLALSACVTSLHPKVHSAATPSPTLAKPTATRSAVAGRALAPELPIATLNPGNLKAGEKDREKALSVGAGSNLTAGEVGYYMEVQEARLRQATSGVDVSIAIRGARIVIGPIGDAFPSDGVSLSKATRSLLNALAPVFKEFAKTLIVVHCYTDSNGPDGYNQRLSERRGLAVARYLSDAGVNVGRLVVVGHGKSDPVASNSTARGRAMNRRIRIEVTPLTK